VNRKRVGLGIAALGAAGAALSGVVALSNANADSSPPVGTGVVGSTVTIDDATGCTIVGAGNVCGPTSQEPTDEDYAADLRGDAAPQPPGPWQFVVVHDEGMGLKVRTSPHRDGLQIGYAEHHVPVWVDCVLKSDFNPEPGSAAGAHWYRIHWPSDTPSASPLQSQPADPPIGWAYSRYLAPVGTNGDVPTCPANP
jgi:hypothetical protein